MRRWGWILAYAAGIGAVFSVLVVVFGWGLYGDTGLVIAVLVLNIIVIMAIWSLQAQIDAIDLALRGVRDESGYSDEVKEGLLRLKENRKQSHK